MKKPISKQPFKSTNSLVRVSDKLLNNPFWQIVLFRRLLLLAGERDSDGAVHFTLTKKDVLEDMSLGKYPMVSVRDKGRSLYFTVLP